MPRFEPFAGLRYSLDRVSIAEVTAPPYDVIDDNERSRLVGGHEHNIVRIDLPASEGGRDPYLVAPELLSRWQEEGILARDAEPCLYIYRMRFDLPDGGSRETLGVIGALELSRPGDGDILPHEHTTPKAKSDRLEMLRCCRVNLSSVWGLSPAAGLTSLCELGEPPEAVWMDSDGVEHALWVLRDQVRIAGIAAAVGSQPVVIADGHHRFETSLAFRDELIAAGDPLADSAALAMTFVVELSPASLTVLPIHRVITGLADGFDLIGALEPHFDISDEILIEEDLAARMEQDGGMALVTPGSCRVLIPRPGLVASTRDLDSSRLDVALATLPAHTLEYQHGVDNAVSRVRTGEMQAGFLLRPATVEQILEIAHGGERMPPKTTFFHPKPRTGVVIRPL